MACRARSGRRRRRLAAGRSARSKAEADAPELFEDLGHLLDQFGPGETEMLATALRSPPVAAELRAALAQAGAGRVFRILHWLGDERALVAPHLVVAALTEGSTQEARALRAAIGAFTRRVLLDAPLRARPARGAAGRHRNRHAGADRCDA